MSFLALLCIASLATAFVSWILGFGVRALAPRLRLMDVPDEGRHRHGRVVALAGGCAAWLAISAALVLAWPTARTLLPAMAWREWMSLVFVPLPLLVVGLLDDRKRLAPGWLLVGAFASIALAVASGVRIDEITNPAGGVLRFSSFVGILLTCVWLLGCIGATKFADGADGVVAGQTVIGSLLIMSLCLSTAYSQPSVALLAGVFASGFVGVLAHNWPRARLFLGEFGSTYAGLGLGILAIISGAKLAIALMAMGVLAADMVFVMARRVWRGRSPLQGDRTHLHFVLLQLGWPSWAVAVTIWGLGLGFGLAALQLQTQGKIVLCAALVCATWGVSLLAERAARQRGTISL